MTTARRGEDTFAVVVSATSVPVPAMLLLFASAVTGIGARRLWRRR